jgi:hypothetical protein
MKNKIFSIHLHIVLPGGFLLALVVVFIATKDSDFAYKDTSQIDATDHSCGSGCQHSGLSSTTKQKPELAPEQRRAAVQKARAFDQWMNESQPTGKDRVIADGLALAKDRRDAMALLIQQDPDAALDQAIGYAEYASLPPEIQALVEKPFSLSAHLDVQIGCGKGFTQHRHFLEFGDGENMELSMPKDHRTGLTKSILPVQGIQLDGYAVVRADTFQAVDGVDADFVSREWPGGQLDSMRDFVTGEPIQGESITAVAGGMVFNFQDSESLNHINRLMAEADARPGKDNGSRWLMVAASGGDLEQFPEQQFVEETVEAAYPPTTGNKTTLVIMVDFSDVTGQPYNPSTIEQNIDVTVSDGLARYSYNQTTMNATVHPTTFRMPNTANYYYSGDLTDALHADAVSAYTGAGNPDPFPVYDTVCVIMKEIGFGWAGLASVGGQKMWLDSTDTGVILHEYGHNYGLSHAQYWVYNFGNAGSTNPIDPTGATENYGDIFDNMGDGDVADGHFGPGPKAFLNWIPSLDWDILSTSSDNGTYRVFRFDHESSTGNRALRVTKSATSDFYWVGFRKDYANNEPFANGVYLTWDRATSGRNQSWLIDTTPGSAGGKNDSALTLGRTFTDTASSVHITPVAIGGTAPNEYIDVTVNFGTFPGNNAPVGSLIGPAAVNARESVLFNVEATDANGDTLAYSWNMGDGLVKPNSSSIAHSWIQGGSYNISVTVSDKKGGTVTLPLIVTVTDPLNTWTARTSNTTRHLYSVATNPTHVIAVGEREILRSSDGVTWASVKPSTDFANVYLYDVCFTGTEFIACGMDWSGTGWEGEIWSSANGTSWSRVHETNVNGTELYGISCNGGVVVAVGNNACVRHRTVAGVWSTVNIGVAASDVLQDVAYGDGVFTLVGHSTTPSYNGNTEIWTSSNGLAWTDRSSGFSMDSWRDFREIHHTGDLFVASGFYGRASYSTNAGQNWQTNQTGNSYSMEAFASGAGLVYAVGINEDAGDADVDLVSMDGQNWTVINPGALDNRNGLGFFANTFISVGQNGTIRQSGAISPTSTYSDFATLHFPGGGPNALPASNPDGDWANNRIEYALGTNPNNASSVPVSPVFSINGSGDPVLDVTRISRVSGAAYSVWWSTNLVNWTRQGLTTTTDNNTLLKVVGDGVDTSGGRGFLRLRID